MAIGRHYPDWIAACVAANNDKELPPEFVLWSAISAVAGALGRKNWYDHGSYQVRPNLFIILVARPGLRKTTSMTLPYEKVFPLLTEPMPGTTAGIKSEIEMSRQRWPQYLREDGATPCRLIVGKITVEELVREIAAISQPRLDLPDGLFDGSVTIRTNEFGTFMNRGSEGLQIFLTEAWDGVAVYEHRTKNHGIDIVRGLCVNWIAAATPQQFIAHLPSDVAEQGLLSRIIPIYHEVPKLSKSKIRGQKFPPKVVKKLAEDLGEISCMKGEWNWDTETEVAVGEWLETEEPLPTSYYCCVYGVWYSR